MESDQSNQLRPKVCSRRNSINSSDSANEKTFSDSLLSFALKMNSSQVATTLMKDQDDMYALLENSSFLTNIVNLSSLKRGLSEQQLRDKMIEEIERARKRLLNRASITRSQSPKQDSPYDANTGSESEAESEDSFSNDSIGSYLDDLRTDFGGIGEQAMEAYESERMVVGINPAESHQRRQLSDKEEVLQIFSSLLEDDSEEDECNEEDESVDSSYVEDFHVKRCSSYFALSKSMQSPKRSAHHLQRLLADAQNRSPSRLPRVSYNVPLSEQPPSLECASLLMCASADPFTSGKLYSYKQVDFISVFYMCRCNVCICNLECVLEFGAIPLSHASSMDYSCLQSREDDFNDDLEDIVLPSVSSISSACGKRHGNRSGSPGEEDGDIGFPVCSPAMNESGNNLSCGGRSGVLRAGSHYCSVEDSDDIHNSERDREIDSQQNRDEEDIGCDSSSSRTSLRSSGKDKECVPPQDLSHVTDIHDIDSSCVDSNPLVFSSCCSSSDALSTLKCMGVGGLNEWLVMNMRSQGVPYTTTHHDEEVSGDDDGVVHMLNNDSSGSDWSELFNRCAIGFLRQMAQAESLETDIQNYIQQRRNLLLAQRTKRIGLRVDADVMEECDPSTEISPESCTGRQGAIILRHQSDSSVGNNECRSVAVRVTSDIIHKGAVAHISRQRYNAPTEPKPTRHAERTRDITDGDYKGRSRRRRQQNVVSRSVLSMKDMGSESKSECKRESEILVRQSWSGSDSKILDDKRSSRCDTKFERREQKYLATTIAAEEYKGVSDRFEAADEELFGEVVLLRQAISESNIMAIKSAMQLGHIAGQIVVENVPG